MKKSVHKRIKSFFWANDMTITEGVVEIVLRYIDQFESYYDIHNGLSNAVVVLRHGHADTKCFSNILRFSEDHLKNGSVNGIVLPIQHKGLHLGSFLAKTIYTTFPLFVACWVPTQIIMHTCRKIFLQVDPLTADIIRLKTCFLR